MGILVAVSVGVVSALMGVVSAVDDERGVSSDGDGEGALGWTREHLS